MKKESIDEEDNIHTLRYRNSSGADYYSVANGATGHLMINSAAAAAGPSIVQQSLPPPPPYRIIQYQQQQQQTSATERRF